MQHNVLVLLEGEEGASARYWILECRGLPAGHLLAGPIYAQVASPIYAQVASLIYAQGHWWRVGWNIANMQFAVLVSGDLESDENIDTA